MNPSGALRRGSMWTLAGLASAVLPLGLLIAALDAGYFKGPLVHFIAARLGRELKVEGPLLMPLFSFHPQVIAERVPIGNPAWTPAGTAATIGKITVMLSLRRST